MPFIEGASTVVPQRQNFWYTLVASMFMIIFRRSFAGKRARGTDTAKYTLSWLCNHSASQMLASTPHVVILHGNNSSALASDLLVHLFKTLLLLRSHASLYGRSDLACHGFSVLSTSRETHRTAPLPQSPKATTRKPVTAQWSRARLKLNRKRGYDIGRAQALYSGL